MYEMWAAGYISFLPLGLPEILLQAFLEIEADRDQQSQVSKISERGNKGF